MKTLGKKRYLSFIPLFGLLPVAMPFQQHRSAGLSRLHRCRRRRTEAILQLLATDRRFFEPLPVSRSDRGQQEVAEGLRILYQRYRPRTIALNRDGGRGQNGGLTYDAHRFLSEALGEEAVGRFVSAAELIEEYFDSRLPEELEPYRSLVAATDVLAQRTLSNEVITPGVTRAVDLKWWFNQQVASLGVDRKRLPLFPALSDELVPHPLRVDRITDRCRRLSTTGPKWPPPMIDCSCPPSCPRPPRICSCG
jgi:hypothetical protein